MTATVVNPVKVFGELKVVAKTNQSLQDLEFDNVILSKEWVIEDNNDRLINLGLHDCLSLQKLEPEFDNEDPSIISAKFVISVDVDEEEEENILWAANLLFSELTVSSFKFKLLTCQGDKIIFDVLDMSVNWNDILYND